MRQLTPREKDIIDGLVTYSEVSTLISVSSYMRPLDFNGDINRFLEFCFLIWFLENNGYVYLVRLDLPNDGYTIPFSVNPQIGIFMKYLSGELRERIVDLWNKDIYVTEQLKDLKEHNYQFVESEQLAAAQNLLMNAASQVEEAKKQTEAAIVQSQEAKKQTETALEQSREAKKQTRLAFFTLILSIATLLASILIPSRSLGNSLEKPKQLTALVCDSTLVESMDDTSRLVLDSTSKQSLADK